MKKTAITIFIVACAGLVGSKLEMPNKDDWIDPNDMLNFDPGSTTMRNKEKEKQATENKMFPDQNHSTEEELVSSQPPPTEEDTVSTQPVTPPCPQPTEPQDCVCEQAALPLMKRYIKMLLKHFDGKEPSSSRDEYNMFVSLTPDQFGILSRFVTSTDPRHVHDAHEVLTGMTERVYRSHLTSFDKTTIWIEDRLGISLHKLIQLVALCSLASVILLVEVKLQIPWRRRINQLIVLMFFISVPWTWYDLYKQAEIKQQSVATKEIPAECQQRERDYWTALKAIFTFQEDKCLDYYEHLMIDPIVRVPPTKAIAVTFVRFFVSPLKDVGSALSEFIKALLIDLPLTLYPFAMVMVGMFLFLFLFMWFGYSIRLPFWVSIEPGARIAVGDGTLQQAITDTSQQVLKQLEDMQQRLESSENKMADKILHLQQVQQAAIEYTISASPSPASSPTISRTDMPSAGLSASYTCTEDTKPTEDTKQPDDLPCNLGQKASGDGDGPVIENLMPDGVIKDSGDKVL